MKTLLLVCVCAMGHAFGMLRWKYETGDCVYPRPVVSPDGKVVYVGSRDNSLYAIDTSQGLECWKEYHNRTVQDDALRAYGVQLGRLIWRYETGGMMISSPALRPDGKVMYVGSGDNNVYAIDTKGGLIWKKETGPAVV